MNLIFIFLFAIQTLFLLIFKPLTELLTILIQIKFIPFLLLFLFAFLFINNPVTDKK